MPVYLGATTATSGDAAWSDISALGFNPANTLIVAESGGQYTTLASALTAAVAGDTVLIFPGTYVVPAIGYTILAGVSIIGVDPATVIFDAVTNAPNTAFTLGAGATLEGITLTMADAVGKVGVLMSGDKAIVRNLVVGAATCVEAITGVRTTAGSAFIENLSFAVAMARGLHVTGAGVGTGTIATNVRTVGNIAGRVATSIIHVEGFVLCLDGAVLAGTNDAEEIHSDGGELTLSGAVFARLLVNNAVANAEACVFDQLSVDATSFVNIPHFYGNVISVAAGATGQLPARAGTAVVLSGTSSIVVPASAISGADGYDGKPAFATLKELNGVVTVVACTWDGSGNLTITLSAVTGADRDVSWFIPG